MEMRRVALEKVFIVASGHSEESGVAAFHIVSTPSSLATGSEWCRTLLTCDFSRVEFDNYLDINLGKACKDVRPRVSLYAEGLDRVEEKDPILGGAAVFRDTRISVLHIGKMAERGESIANILEDYSGLTEGDVEFAKLYYRARPPLGRPRATGTTEHVNLTR